MTHASATSTTYELRGITKRFPGVVANDDVNLVIRTGEVLCLVGENGAGKSTLMNVLYGLYRADEGELRIDGTPTTFHSPADAIAAGIGMVHQHFMLADNLTITENIILGNEPTTTRGRIDFAAAHARIGELMATLGVDFDLDAPVSSLGVGQRQRVEILKVLYRGARILILDEPTAVLVPQEVEELFATLKRLVSAEGRTVIFISHKLDEVLSYCDEITVIRQGTTVATTTPREIDRRGLAEIMVGTELPGPTGRTTSVGSEIVLRCRGLEVAGAIAGAKSVVESADLEVHSAEIVGVAGVEGNGQFELCGDPRPPRDGPVVHPLRPPP